MIIGFDVGSETGIALIVDHDKPRSNYETATLVLSEAAKQDWGRALSEFKRWLASFTIRWGFPQHAVVVIEKSQPGRHPLKEFYSWMTGQIHLWAYEHDYQREEIHVMTARKLILQDGQIARNAIMPEVKGGLGFDAITDKHQADALVVALAYLEQTRTSR